MKPISFFVALSGCVVLLGCTQPPSPAGANTSSEPKPITAPATGAYGKKETYAHASSDVSTSALIAGGATSGGPAVAPSATAIEGRLQEWRLSPEDISAEMKSGRPIVRSKPAPADATAHAVTDEALVTLVNNRLVADADTGRLTIKLTSSHGEVTMRGSAASSGLVGRAIAIALDTPGVTQVTAEFQLDSRLPTALRDETAQGSPTPK